MSAARNSSNLLRKRLHVNFRGETPSLFAPPAMTHTAAYGPCAPIPLNGTHQQGHGQSRLQPALSKLSGGGDPYDTFYHPYFRWKTPSLLLFAPLAMAHTTACGPFETVPNSSAR